MADATKLKLTKQQIEDFREAFSLFDHDENGSISAKELGEVLRALGQDPSDTELRDMINEVDVDGNGTVEFEEFLILMTNKVKEMTKEDEIREAFRVLDRNRDDKISVDELKYFMRKVAHVKLSSVEAEEMIRFADLDKDGFINFEEFLSIVNLTTGPEQESEGGSSSNSSKSS